MKPVTLPEVIEAAKKHGALFIWNGKGVTFTLEELLATINEFSVANEGEAVYQYCPDHFQPELWIDCTKEEHDSPDNAEDYGFENKPYPRRILFTAPQASQPVITRERLEEIIWEALRKSGGQNQVSYVTNAILAEIQNSK